MKLQFSTPTFKTFNDSKVTVCTYQCNIVSPKGKVISSFKVSGKAILSPSDTYDANIARRLSDSRAKEIAYRTVAAEMPSYLLEEKLKQLNEAKEVLMFYKKMHYLRNSESKHIKDIV